MLLDNNGWFVLGNGRSLDGDMRMVQNGEEYGIIMGLVLLVLDGLWMVMDGYGLWMGYGWLIMAHVGVIDGYGWLVAIMVCIIGFEMIQSNGWFCD